MMCVVGIYQRSLTIGNRTIHRRKQSIISRILDLKTRDLLAGRQPRMVRSQSPQAETRPRGADDETGHSHSPVVGLGSAHNPTLHRYARSQKEADDAPSPAGSVEVVWATSTPPPARVGENPQS